MTEPTRRDKKFFRLKKIEEEPKNPHKIKTTTVRLRRSTIIRNHLDDLNFDSDNHFDVKKL